MKKENKKRRHRRKKEILLDNLSEINQSDAIRSSCAPFRLFHLRKWDQNSDNRRRTRF